MPFPPTPDIWAEHIWCSDPMCDGSHLFDGQTCADPERCIECDALLPAGSTSPADCDTPHCVAMRSEVPC